MKHERRNGFMLNGALARQGYDWWWHSLVAEAEDGTRQAFFIEYFVVNPGLRTPEPVWGQVPGGAIPCYAMIKAGKWGDGKAQVHNFWPVGEFSAAVDRMDVRIGANVATESRLHGEVRVSAGDASSHPEWMSDAGSMSWDLTVSKPVSYSVGYGASAPLRALGAFDMFWHVQGMKTLYEGTIVFNGTSYRVRPESCCGYQDKNWGRDFTSPWIWLNCNSFSDREGRLVPNAVLDVGGGEPRVFGASLGEKVLAAFSLDGVLYEFNFSHVLFQQQDWACEETDTHIVWRLDLKNRRHRLQLDFQCAREEMLLVNYENPRGEKRHNRLWNGGTGRGTLVLSERRSGKVLQSLVGDWACCEYGREG